MNNHPAPMTQPPGHHTTGVLHRQRPHTPRNLVTVFFSATGSLTVVVFFTAIALFALGIGLRLYDLTDQPIDFHPTRQLRSAIIARGMYFQVLPDADPVLRKQAIGSWYSTGQYEPSFLERVVAYTYLQIGGEKLWVSRIYTSLFWIIGGIALYSLARRMLGTTGAAAAGAALATLGYYLVLPFAMQASRSFQPDPGMVMWIVLSVYTLYRWSEKPSWKWAVLTGILAGIGVLVKVVASYIVAGAAIALVLNTLGIKRFWRNPQVWVMAFVMVAPSVIYYLVQRQGRASEYFEGWTISLSHLLLEPTFYVRWFSLLQDLMGMTALLLGLIGVLISPGVLYRHGVLYRQSPNRALLFGLWAGYAVYGLFLPYQMYTHSYYHLQLVPIVALSLAPVAQVILERLFQQKKFWQVLFVGIVLVGVAYPAWLGIYAQSRENFRNEPAYWQEVAGHLPSDGKILALTQDYGYRLLYYGWRKVTLWPNRGEQNLASLRGISKDFEVYFNKRLEGKSYFLITAFNQFNDQPDLKQMLNERYPVVAEGSGYLIFDLLHPIGIR